MNEKFKQVINNSFFVTMVKLLIAYLVGYMIFGVGYNDILSGIVTLLIYGFAEIIEAIRSLKQ